MTEAISIEIFKEEILVDCDFNLSFTTLLGNWQKQTKATGGVGTITLSPQVLEILDHALSEYPEKGMFVSRPPIVSPKRDADEILFPRP